MARPGVEAGCFWADSLPVDPLPVDPLPVDPLLDRIRSDSRFPALLQMAYLGNVSKDAVSNAAVYVTPHSRGFGAAMEFTRPVPDADVCGEWPTSE